MMVSLAILALTFVVGCSSAVIHPCGPRMCEKIIQMLGTNTSIYQAESLACNLTDRQTSGRSVEQRKGVQMRCVMCTEVPIQTKMERCHIIHENRVCIFAKDLRSCVITSHKGIDYNYHCGKESGLSRIQRQMICVLLSRLVKANVLGPQWSQQMKPGVKVLIEWNTIYESKKELTKSKMNIDHIFIPIAGGIMKMKINGKRIAVESGNMIQIMRYLMEKPEIIDGVNSKGFTPTMFSVIFHQDILFHLLMGLGADITAVNEKIGMDSLLHYACQDARHQLRFVKLFVNLGFDVERRGVAGRSPLAMAAPEGEEEVFNYLLSLGCNVNALDQDRNSILHLSCFVPGRGKLSILRQSIGSIDIESRNNLGETPLAMCARRGAHEMVKYLEEQGGDM